ncbi:S41 family peptidase [Streptomyces sp. NRRL F-5123]|uniref:S41 family peptidase n=1 Tax=Streptomyces sp. NRRL F-5123 TaxID=1463856 RepID=UPI0004E185CD|nr:S41 family peptidase [Streptomyces sp. NRRL F-5123]
MSGPLLFGTPRRIRRGATLTLVFGTMLATGAAAGSFAEPQARDRTRVAAATSPSPAATGRADSVRAAGAAGGADGGADRSAAGGREGRAGAAGPAVATGQGKAGPQAARKLVSRSGDRWSSYYTAQEYAGLQEALDGRYVGVGLWVRQVDGGRIEIARVQSGSPAASAGIRVGDVLVSIDATACTGLAVTEVVADLRGDNVPGTTVTLVLLRGGSRLSATVQRATLPTEAVTVSHPDGPQGPTLVAVDAFSLGTGKQVRAAVQAARHGVLLDLRGNSGGLVEEAVATASALLDGGLVATYDVHGEQQALYADPGGDTAVPLVVLVDGGTMSAAEMLAGALQDRGRAVVVGSRTFGKGSVQMPSTLPDGSVAELTVGHYRLPDGRSVDGHGIEPDVQVTGGDDALAEARSVMAGLGTPS